MVAACVSGAANAEGRTRATTKKTVHSTPAIAEQQPVLSAEEKTAQIAYLDKLGSDLVTCRAAYTREMSALQGLVTLKIMSAEIDAGRFGLSAVQRVTIENDIITEYTSKPSFGKCERDATAEFQNTSGSFIRRFADPKLQDKAKDALARWMSAIAAVSKKTFETEQGEYAVRANILKLELSI